MASPSRSTSWNGSWITFVTVKIEKRSKHDNRGNPDFEWQIPGTKDRLLSSREILNFFEFDVWHVFPEEARIANKKQIWLECRRVLAGPKVPKK
jgi:hypothetical protein